MRLSAAVSLLALLVPVSVAVVSLAYAENVGEATRATRPGARRLNMTARLRSPSRLWPGTFLIST